MSFAFSLHVVVRFTNQTRKNKWVGTSIVSKHIYVILLLVSDEYIPVYVYD